MDCKCISVYSENKPNPTYDTHLTREGCSFELISDDGDPPSWYSTRIHKCENCGQLWKEEFVEAMQYNANHWYPINKK